MLSGGDILAAQNFNQTQQMLGGMTALNGGAAEAFAGGMMSRGRAIGGPMMSGIQGLMGLDPLTMGARAGMSAWGSGAGLMGAGAAGLGMAAGVGIIGAGVGFMGNQMYSGAQQQMQLNQGLRQNYNFMNAQGGMGFTSNQGMQIGGSIRGMTNEFGKAGEVSTFGELSRLASNMGRMGMAQDVRSVKEFKEKFKSMVDTLKTIAHDMGSSLEEAQKFMASMKGSGIFKKADQLKMSGQTRLTALAGGLAQSEVTSMASIGSQISRSIGGTGRSGAFGGMKAIGDIGMAQQIGAISEEDIYNATGLTGAEGRQALATSRMQGDASFLTSNRGRVFMASMAGADGHMDQKAMMRTLMGGNTTAQQSLAEGRMRANSMGRAKFLRNEGHMRGEMLEKFGGSTQAIALSGWLGEKGWDPNTMDDMSMMAFQRFSGMGRDDADAMIKQIQKMPELMQHEMQTGNKVGYADKIAHQRKTQGIEGMKRKFNIAQEQIQGHFQQAGADILSAGENMVNRWFNETMGIYEKTTSENVQQALELIKLGGPGAKGISKGMFGGGGVGGAGMIAGADKLSAIHSKHLSALSGISDPNVTSFSKANIDMVQQATMAGMVQDFSTGTSRAGAFVESLRTQAGSDPAAKAMAERLANATGNEQAALIQTMQRDAGISKESQLVTHLGKESEEALRTLGGHGKYRTKGDADAALGRMLAGGPEDVVGRKRGVGEFGASVVASFAGGVIGGVGGMIDVFSTKTSAIAFGLQGLNDADAAKEGLAVHDTNENRAANKEERRKAGLSRDSNYSIAKRLWAKDGEAAAGWNAGAREGDKLIYSFFGNEKEDQGMALALTGDGGKGLEKDLASLISGDEDGKKQSQNNIRRELMQTFERMHSKGYEPSPEEKGRIKLLGRTLTASTHADTIAKLQRGEEVDPSKLAQLKEAYMANSNGSELDTTPGSESMRQLGSAMRVGGTALARLQGEASVEAIKTLTSNTIAEQQKMVATGSATYVTDQETGKKSLVMNAATMKGLKAGSQEDKAAYLAMDIMNSDFTTKEGREGWESNWNDFSKNINNMSSDEQKDFAMRFAGTEYGTRAAIAQKRGAAYKAREGKVGKSGAIAEALGLDIDKDTLAKLEAKPGGATAEDYLAVAGVTGVDASSKLVTGLNAAIKDNQSGARGNAIATILAQTADSTEGKALKDAQAKGPETSEDLLKDMRDTANLSKQYLFAIVQSNADSRDALKNMQQNSGGTKGNAERVPIPPGAATPPGGPKDKTPTGMGPNGYTYD